MARQDPAALQQALLEDVKEAEQALYDAWKDIQEPQVLVDSQESVEEVVPGDQIQQLDDSY